VSVIFFRHLKEGRLYIPSEKIQRGDKAFLGERKRPRRDAFAGEGRHITLPLRKKGRGFEERRSPFGRERERRSPALGGGAQRKTWSRCFGKSPCS